ncbi:hypothetical protein EW093_06820 [Thiospirochaeta perfilievii]|uniref:Glycoside hydrolase family 2 catalytic domain-containing protein n=1 Tax=Thiospirochaeta perfilievii TaxID=252967 RepID=A0A5C1QBI1_9SPIO|nr:glycoside hydrolase family 2 TIM barrel-domain containing protein [Thiospirochaeta perfilievii]QEN04420.1 hypothetical protein EW093_06820 [Thiospirochaeta perfilievii]
MRTINRVILLLLLALIGFQTVAQVNKVEIKQDDNGFRLFVDKKPFEVKGVVWAFTPIGEKYTYDLWSQSDEFIKRMIDTDAELMKQIGVNSIRVFSEVPARWIEYLYFQHGIYTIVNYTFGRYGVTVNGKWHARTDYSDFYTREAIKEEAFRVIKDYRNTPGVLMFMFGNENNYGLEWESDNIENLPTGQRMEARAGYLYSLYEEVLEVARRLDHNHPSGIVNGDIQYLNIIEALVPSMKIMGVNTYRGSEASDLFYKSIQGLNVPVVFTEFGADAYNTKTDTEDQYHQAQYIRDQWKEIYSQSYGKGKYQNAVGGFVFEWIDEWWKNGLDSHLDVHATVGSWTNGGYRFDAETGTPNMNEEWFGIVAQSQLKKAGINRRIPRAAFYTLGDIWSLSMYDSTPEEVEEHFAKIDPIKFVSLGEANVTKNEQKLDFVSIDGIKLDLNFSESFSNLEVQAAKDSNPALYQLPELTERRSEELTLTFGFKPVENLTGDVSVKFRGSTYDPLFTDPNVNQEPVQLYSGSFEYTNPLFDINGYFHTGLADWYLEGDYFNMMPESFDMDGMDLNGSLAPYGLMFTGNGSLDGLKIYAGPEIYYGARPQAIAKYTKDMNSGTAQYGFAALIQQDFDVKEIEVGENTTQSASLSGHFEMYPYVDVIAGGYFAGSDKVGETYSTDGGLSSKEITLLDSLSGKVDLSTKIFRYTELYGRYVYSGLVADTNAMMARGGLFKADSGLGNRQEINIGAKIVYSDLTFDIVGRSISPLVGPDTSGNRNPLTAPFYVYHNRETLEGEMVITFDPTGATWFHDWNAFDIEEAKFAGSISLLYILSTGVSDIGKFKANSTTEYAFSSPMEACENLWSVKLKTISNPLPQFKIGFDYFIGVQQSFGTDLVPLDDGSNRLTRSMGADLKVKYNKLALEGNILLNGWGFENSNEWQRDWNITYPLQWKVDLAYFFDKPKFSVSTSKIGIFARQKTYSEYSDIADATREYDMEIGIYSSMSY